MPNNVQPNYRETMEPARAGMVHGSDWNSVTLVCETEAGIGFGRAVTQGAADRGAVLGGASEDFRGITIRDVTLESSQADKYARYQNMGVLTRGQIWVVPPVAVAPGDLVYFIPSTGVLTNSASGNELIEGARWRSTAAGTGDLALVEIPAFAPPAT